MLGHNVDFNKATRFWFYFDFDLCFSISGLVNIIHFDIFFKR